MLCISVVISAYRKAMTFIYHWNDMVMWVWITASAHWAAKPRSGHTCTCELPSSPYSPPCASGHSRSFLLSNTLSMTLAIKEP